MGVKSTRMNAAVQVVFAVTLVAIGQLCMRRGMVEIEPVASLNGLWHGVWVALHSPEILVWTLAGASAYVLATLAWLRVLARHELSLVFPFTSISYVLVYLGAINWPLLDEQPSFLRTLGILVIMAGVALVARSGRRQHGQDL